MSAADPPLLSAGCRTLLPTVGTHERPHSSEMLLQRLSSPIEAALFLMADGWEVVLSPESITIGSNSAAVDVQQHYRTVWEHHVGATAAEGSSKEPLTSETVHLLKQIAQSGACVGDTSTTLPPHITFPALRARFALQSQRVEEFVGTAQMCYAAVEKTHLLDTPLCVHLATTEQQPLDSRCHQVCAFTILLLSQYRSSKQVAARKWIAYMDGLCSTTTSDSPKSTVFQCCAAAYIAGMALSVPPCGEKEENLRKDLAVHLGVGVLPQLQPAFVALFWCAVIEQLAPREAQKRQPQPSLSVEVKHITAVALDYFYAMLASHLGFEGPHPSAIFSSDAQPTSASISPRSFDAYFGIHMPTMWQQLGFEWPWSAFARVTRARVNDVRKSLGDSAAEVLSKRVDQFWNNIAFVVAPRSYRQRMEQVIPPSLHRHVEAAYLLNASRSFPTPIDHTILTDLNRIATETTKKLAQLTPGDVAAGVDAITVASLAVDALPHIVLLRREASGRGAHGSAEVIESKVVAILWIFLSATSRLAVRAQYRDLFLTTFSDILEKIRTNGAAIFDNDEGTTTDEQQGCGYPTKSPFVQVASLWLAAVVDKHCHPDQRILLQRRIGYELLHFMSVCYLPLKRQESSTADAQAPYSLGLGITARDIVALFAFTAGASDDAGTSLWGSVDADTRILMRDVVRRVAHLEHRFSSKMDDGFGYLDDVSRQILRLESDQLRNWLRAFIGEDDGGHLGSAPCWFSPFAILQRSLSTVP